jgi:hypothetical protein
MLRRLAMHLSSGALKFTEHDFDTGNWIAALNSRADVLEGRHPAAPAGEWEEAYREGFNNGTALCIAQLQADADQGRTHHERLMSQHGWVKQARLAALEAELAHANAQIDEFRPQVESMLHFKFQFGSDYPLARQALDLAMELDRKRIALEASHAALQAKLDAVAGLVGKWRAWSRGIGKSPVAAQWAYTRCADELESALAE